MQVLAPAKSLHITPPSPVCHTLPPPTAHHPEGQRTGKTNAILPPTASPHDLLPAVAERGRPPLAAPHTLCLAKRGLRRCWRVHDDTAPEPQC
jgi:hypothetical protein